MKIPEKIKIGGITYKIDIVDKICRDDHLFGEIIEKEQRIEIARAQPDMMNLTFFHEILHGINGQMSEETIEFLAMAFYQLVVDNPELFEGSDRE